MLGTFIFHYQDFIKASLPDMLLCAKFWLCIFFGKEYFKNFHLIENAKHIYFHVKLVTWFYFLLSVVNYIFKIYPFFDYRYGLGANRLFYSHPTVLISCCSFLILIILGLKPHIKSSLFYIILLSLTMCTTLRAKAIANVLIFVIIYYFAAMKKDKFTIKSILPFIPLVAYIGWSQIEYYFITIREGSARAQLLLKSFEIAKDHFPFGSGFGTYGSYYSSVYYSPIYYKYGLNTIFGMSLDNHKFLCDSFWPMILGQSGFVGVTLYVIAIWKLFVYIVKLRKIDLYLFISAIGTVCYLLVDSTAATAFVHPLSMPMAIWLGIIISYVQRYSILNGFKNEIINNKE